MLQNFGLSLAQTFAGLTSYGLFSFLVTGTTRIKVWKVALVARIVSVNILKDILQQSSFFASFDPIFCTDSTFKISSCTVRNATKIKVSWVASKARIVSDNILQYFALTVQGLRFGLVPSVVCNTVSEFLRFSSDWSVNGMGSCGVRLWLTESR
jgi:hypothetical protein